MSSNSLNSLISFYINRQIRKDRCSFVTKLLFLLFCILFLFCTFLFVHSDNVFSFKNPHVALIKIYGVIDKNSVNNSDHINKSLSKAFGNKNTKAVIVKINSPGGSPVESDNIYNCLRYLINKYPDITLYAVCDDFCTSGGYYIASAAHYIYANKMTLVGSIGVRACGFGFVDFINKLGIERRSNAVGKDKEFLDAFLPQQQSQISSLNAILHDIYEVFVNSVKSSRGEKLNMKYKDLIFSGTPCSGIQAKEYGLIDDFGSLESVIRDHLHDLPVIDYTKSLTFIDKFSSRLSNEICSKISNQFSKSEILLK